MTRDPTLALFVLLERAGIQPPYIEAEQLEHTLAAWELALSDVDDEALKAAVAAWLRDPIKGRWWPKPGELLALVPRAVPEHQDEGSWPGQLLAQVQPGSRRVELLDQATAEVRDRPACGRSSAQRCPSTCEPCAEAILLRADELARIELSARGAAA